MEQFHARITESFRQPRHHAAIFFDEGDRDVLGEKVFRQSTKSGSDFDHMITRVQTEAGHDPTRKILIVQKILAEALARLGVQSRESPLDFGESHGLRIEDSPVIHKLMVNKFPLRAHFLPKLFT